MRSLSTKIAAVSLVAASVFATPSADAYRPFEATYRITITNLTTGQPLTPPVIAIHNSRADVFEVGEPANEGVRQIAENGNNAPLVSALSGDYNVAEIIEGTAPIVPDANPGGTPFDSVATFEFTTDSRAQFVSIVAMLICTNDGFTGLDSIRLPFRSATYYTKGYDTRTEQNTEDLADIVPPCQGLAGFANDDAGTGESNPELVEGGVIIPHQGIFGDNDLQPRVHGWTDPVAKIVIERISISRRW